MFISWHVLIRAFLITWHKQWRQIFIRNRCLPLEEDGVAPKVDTDIPLLPDMPDLLSLSAQWDYKANKIYTFTFVRQKNTLWLNENKPPPRFLSVCFSPASLASLCCRSSSSCGTTTQTQYEELHPLCF